MEIKLEQTTEAKAKANEQLSNMMNGIASSMDVDKRSRTIANLSLGFMLVLALFVSLANADWDIHAIFTAKFWFDFVITFGGGQFLKFVYGKAGIFEGYKNKDVIREMEALHANNAAIKAAGLIGALKKFIADSNLARKFRAFRKYIYAQALRHPRNNYYEEQKEIIRKYELLQKTTDEEKREELKRELEDANFDLETMEIIQYKWFGLKKVKLKYNRINEGMIGTGFENSNNDEEDSMDFSEMYELYGKSAIFTAITVGISFLFSFVSVSASDWSLQIIIVFFTRVFVYVLNSFVGYSTGKTSIEVTKLNILGKINKFLGVFLETNKTQEVS